MAFFPFIFIVVILFVVQSYKRTFVQSSRISILIIFYLHLLILIFIKFDGIEKPVPTEPASKSKKSIVKN
ncbi:hypothetical protein HX13_21580 [Chryseobacterium sp. P1-3]|nr:hypothetical protein HX13_21580 [Chryseobacterium sp. P1-3]